MTPNIIYEDNHIVVVNKKAGEITQGDKTGDETLPDALKSWLKEKYQKPGAVFLGVIHRLDRPTSGIVVFAKTGKALARMNEVFKSRKVEKNYWAIVENPPPALQGTLTDFLRKNKSQNKSYVVEKGSEASKEAVLTYKLLAKSERYYLLEINPLTGRHHQIRTQLANIGCTIKGDLKYGAKSSNSDGGISLHARSLRFIHPVKKEPLFVEAEVPQENLWKYFEDQIKKKTK